MRYKQSGTEKNAEEKCAAENVPNNQNKKKNKNWYKCKQASLWQGPNDAKAARMVLTNEMHVNVLKAVRIECLTNERRESFKELIFIYYMYW